MQIRIGTPLKKKEHVIFFNTVYNIGAHTATQRLLIFRSTETSKIDKTIACVKLLIRTLNIVSTKTIIHLNESRAPNMVFDPKWAGGEHMNFNFNI